MIKSSMTMNMISITPRRIILMTTRTPSPLLTTMPSTQQNLPILRNLLYNTPPPFQAADQGALPDDEFDAEIDDAYDDEHDNAGNEYDDADEYDDE
jgi:hypothetical protein